MAQPKKARAGIRFFFVALGLGLAGIIAIGTRSYDKGGISYDEKVGGERLKTLAEVQAAADAKLKSYEWLDKEKGIVQVPIQRAMELTVAELGKQNPVASEVKAESPGTNLIPPYLKEAPAEGDSTATPEAEAAPAEGAATPATEAATTPASEATAPAPTPEEAAAPQATPAPEATTPQANP